MAFKTQYILIKSGVDPDQLFSTTQLIYIQTEIAIKGLRTRVTPGRLQSKTPILSRNVDQKSIEQCFRLPFVAPLATNDNRKHCFYRLLTGDRRLLITFSIAAYPVWRLR